MSQVYGVIVVARNGDRLEYYQDPNTYNAEFTETTALGEVQSFQLGSLLKSLYLDVNSPLYIKDMRTDLVDKKSIHVRVKGGGEGNVVFDSAIALLQGLFPPTSKNKILLANGTTVVAPLGGYQYVPVETVEPENDRSLESWTNCPAFTEHVGQVYSSDEFKAKAKDAQPFLNDLHDFLFGKPATLQNIWNVYDFIHSQLTHNQTYAYRLPPTFIEQARALANYHEDRIFSDSDMRGIGNMAGRTLLHTIIDALERIAFNHNPLKLLVVETTYQPFISLSHQLHMFKNHPRFEGIPNYAAALVIELRRGVAPDTRDFLRFKFKNGTQETFETVHVLGHHADIPLTEFIYRTEGAAISNNKQWAQICGVKATGFGITNSGITSYTGAIVFIILVGLVLMTKLKGRERPEARQRKSGVVQINSESVNKFNLARYAMKDWTE